jgi:hypothetical protein
MNPAVSEVSYIKSFINSHMLPGVQYTLFGRKVPSHSI